MQTSPVDHARSGAPFLAVAGLCAIGVSLLIVIVMILSSALEDPLQADAISPNAVQPGPGVTLRSPDPSGAAKDPVRGTQTAQASTLVALVPPGPAPKPVRSVGDDLPPVTRTDNVDFPRGKGPSGDRDDQDRDDGGFFDGDIGSRNLSSKNGYSTDGGHKAGQPGGGNQGKGPQGQNAGHGNESKGAKNHKGGKGGHRGGAQHGRRA